MTKQNSILKNIFISVLSFAVLLCLSFSFTACGGPNMTQSYSLARAVFQEMTGVTLPEKSEIEVSIDASKTHMSLDMFKGKNISQKTFEDFVACFDKLEGYEKSEQTEGPDAVLRSIGEASVKTLEGLEEEYSLIEYTYTDSEEENIFKVGFRPQANVIYINASYPETEIDFYAKAKANIQKTFGQTLPSLDEYEGIEFTSFYGYYFYPETYIGVSIDNASADLVDDLNEYFDELLLTNENNGWVKYAPASDSSGTTYQYNNNKTGMAVYIYYNTNEQQIWFDVGNYGIKHADTFAEASKFLKQAHGITLPSFGNAQITLSENSFSLYEIEFDFSSDDFTVDDYNAVVNAFNKKLGNWSDLANDDMGGQETETDVETGDSIPVHTWWRVDNLDGELTNYNVYWNNEDKVIGIYIELAYYI